MSEISQIMLSCLANQGDKDAVYVKVDSLMSFTGWINPEVAKANFENIVTHVKKLPKPFLDAEGGWSFLNMPFFDNGQGGAGEQWGEQFDAGCLIVICAYYGIVQDNLTALNFQPESLRDLPGKVSYFAFNVEEHYLNFVRTHLKIK